MHRAICCRGPEELQNETWPLKSVPISEKVREKILFIRAYYEWENEEIQELACYLLERFPSLLLTGDLITLVDEKMEKKNKNTVSETLFFQGMEEIYDLSGKIIQTRSVYDVDLVVSPLGVQRSGVHG